MIEPQIIDSPAISFIGMECLFRHALSEETNDMAVIPQLWGRFGSKRETVPNQTEPSAAWGIITADPEEERSHADELRYLAAAQVSFDSEVPEGMIVRAFPAAKYACFTLRGPISRIGEHCQMMYREWLPQSPWEHAGIADLERYDERFCAESEDSEIDYWISIKPKS